MSYLKKMMLIAYDSAYSMDKIKPYSGPYMYDGGGKISERWYVYYSFRPAPGEKLVRQGTIDTGVNIHKNVRDRRKALERLCEAVGLLLANGYNPYTDEPIRLADPFTELTSTPLMSVDDARKFVINLKSSQYGTALADFKSRINRFCDWLLDNGFNGRMITEVNRQAVIHYLNKVQGESSPRNRNNSRIAISTFFSELVEAGVVPVNFVSSIKTVDAKPVRNKSLTDDLVDRIFAELHRTEKGRTLALFIFFISYNILRPIEVVRLRVGHVHLKDRVLDVHAKNKAVKRKRIPEAMVQLLPDLSTLDRGDWLFALSKIGGKWETAEKDKRQYYSDMFNEMIKKPFGLGRDYGLYSFRHTFITKMYNALLETGISPDEAQGRLMQITGHTSRKALVSYLRDIDAVLPDDYSSYLK